jgi:hypothetical protein
MYDPIARRRIIYLALAIGAVLLLFGIHRKWNDEYFEAMKTHLGWKE